MIFWCCVLSAGIGAAFASIPNLIVTGIEDAGFTLAFLLGAIGALVAAASVLLIPGRVREPLPSAA